VREEKKELLDLPSLSTLQGENEYILYSEDYGDDDDDDDDGHCASISFSSSPSVDGFFSAAFVASGAVFVSE